MTGRRARSGLRVPTAIMRRAAGQLGGRALDPALPWPVQRTRLDQATRIARLPRRTAVTEQTIAGLRAEVVSSRAPGSGLTVIHFHGGGYCRRQRPTRRVLSVYVGVWWGSGSFRSVSAWLQTCFLLVS
jgi:hypothetical protein